MAVYGVCTHSALRGMCISYPHSPLKWQCSDVAQAVRAYNKQIVAVALFKQTAFAAGKRLLL